MRFTLLILLFLCSFKLEGKELAIALVDDGPSLFSEKARHQVIQEIEDLLQSEYTLIFSEAHEFPGKSTEDRVDLALEDPKYDYVVGLGFIASYALSQKRELSKPSFAPFILNHKLQNTPFHEGLSGEKNLNYTEVCSTLSDALDLFKELTPFRHLTIVISPNLKKAMPNLKATADRWAFDHGVDVSLVEPNRQLPRGSDAVFFTPLPKMERSKKNCSHPIHQPKKNTYFFLDWEARCRAWGSCL